jgi:hypothetical protein
MPKPGFIQGNKTNITVQVPQYLKQLIDKHPLSQTELVVRALCDKLGITLEELMKKNQEAWQPVDHS